MEKWLDKYDDGGPIKSSKKTSTLASSRNIGTISTPIREFDFKKILPKDSYSTSGTIYKENCPGGYGCSEQSTDVISNITGVNRQSLSPMDAAYRNEQFNRDKAKLIWSGVPKGFDPSVTGAFNNVKQIPKSLYPNLQIGDFIGLTKESTTGLNYTYDNNEIENKYFKSKDKDEDRHWGEIIGFTEEGVPLVRHGWAPFNKLTGEHYPNRGEWEINPIDNINIKGTSWYPTKIRRPKVFENKDISVSRDIIMPSEEIAANKAATTSGTHFYLGDNYEENLLKEYPVAANFSGAQGRLDTKNHIINMMNNPKLDKELQYKFGITATELNNLKPVIYGIAGQEQTFNDVDNPLAELKDIPGNILNLSNSKGLFQIKYNSLTKEERDLIGINSPNDLLDDDKSYKAAVLMMSHAKNVMDKKVEDGTHPELKDADPYFRAAYFYNSPARAINSSEDWAKGSDPITWWKPNTYLNPLFTRERPGIFSSTDPNYVERNELRMDKGSYPYKLQQRAKDLMQYIDADTPQTLEPVKVLSTKKAPKKENGGWLDKYNNGGYIQENYNDSSVSLPEGFVGMGNNTQGRNYSPAWDGQFEDGGNVPKAQNGLWTTNKRGYVDSALNANKHLDWVKRLYDANPKAVMVPGEKYSSTHLMGDDNQGYVFPSIVNMNGQLVDLGDGAEDYARETNTGIQFPKEQGTWFARSTNDKSGYKMGTGVLKGTPVMQKYKSIDKKAMGGNIPGAMGNMYARTGAPSKGPRRNQTDVTDASAQNGAEMQFYQNGLDWQPRNISKNGSEIPRAQVGLNISTQDNLRPMPLYDQFKINEIKTNKENKERVNAETTLVRAGMDPKNAKIQANPKTRLKTSQKLLDEQTNKEYRTRMSQGYNPNKPIEDQYDLANIRGLDQRLYRGANMVMNQDLGNPILNVAKDIMFSPGKSFVNMSNPVENYVKPGFAQGATNLGMDLLNVAPTMVGEGVGKAINATKKVGKQAGKYLIPGSSNVGITSNVDELVDLYRIQEKGAKTFAERAAEGNIPKYFNTPEVLARKAEEEKYFGQWFTKDKNDFDFYKADREFTNPEIINLKIPKSKLEQYSQYDKSLSRAPDREFVIPFEEQKLYKQLPGSPNVFKSEIDWGKWNEEIPNNKALMQEYNAIEQQAKANDTWMKNPDGSAFQGTPEQFVQQQSSWFKKAFPEGFDETYRGISNFYNTNKLNEPLFTGDISNASHYASTNSPGFWDPIKHKIGEGTKFGDVSTQSPEHLSLVREASKTGDWAKVRQYELNKVIESNSGGIHNYYVPKSNNKLVIDAKGKEWTNIPYEGREMPTDFVAEDLFHKNLDYIDINNVRDPRIGNIKIINPNRVNVKSTRGNVGFFDMTNPNIYKSIVPFAIGLGSAGALQQKKQGGVIKDDRGQWDHPGEITRISGGNITMGTDPRTGIPLTQPLLGIADTGEEQMMYPGQDYEFEGAEYVTEYPKGKRPKKAKNGVNQQDEKVVQQLDQLLNFTNYNKPTTKKGWLDKYQ